MNESYVNLYPLLKFVVILLAVFGACFLLNNLIGFVKDLFFKSKDTSITNNLIDKSLFSKDSKTIAIDNNREIQLLTEDVESLKKEFKTMNEKLDYIVKEMTKRG